MSTPPRPNEQLCEVHVACIVEVAPQYRVDKGHRRSRRIDAASEQSGGVQAEAASGHSWDGVSEIGHPGAGFGFIAGEHAVDELGCAPVAVAHRPTETRGHVPEKDAVKNGQGGLIGRVQTTPVGHGAVVQEPASAKGWILIAEERSASAHRLIVLNRTIFKEVARGNVKYGATIVPCGVPPVEASDYL